jgi:hypothetical protein
VSHAPRCGLGAVWIAVAAWVAFFIVLAIVIAS